MLAALCLIAAPAAGHAVSLTFTFHEDDTCPPTRVSCIAVTGGPGTEDNIRDDTAEIRFEGVHPIQVTVENGGDVDHNLTFEPGTPLANYSVDDPVEPGGSVTFNFTTVEDVPPGTYAFYGGQAGHQDLGEEGTFRIDPAPQQEGGNDSSDVVEEVIGVPGPGPIAALAVLGLVAGAGSRRHS